MGFHYEGAASWWRRGRPLSAEASYGLRLRLVMKSRQIRTLPGNIDARLDAIAIRSLKLFTAAAISRKSSADAEDQQNFGDQLEIVRLSGFISRD